MGDHNHGTTTPSPGGGGGGGGGDGGHMQHMMQMYFYANEQATILFSPWVTTKWEEMLGSCIGVLVMAILYEGLKAARLWLNVVANSRSSTVTVYNNGTYVERHPDDHSESKGKDERRASDTRPLTWEMRSSKLSFHILQSVLHIIQVGIGYLLMLISMTFNAYLFISICIGCGFGYLFFNYKRPIIVDTNEHCHL